MSVLLPAPDAIRAAGQWQFGRYSQPFSAPDLHALGMQKFRLKQWHYLSLNSDDWFFALALVDLGYLATLFAYFVPKRAPEQFVEVSSISPLSQALSFAPSSVSGSTTWRSQIGEVQIHGSKKGWQCALDLRLKKKIFKGEFLANAGDHDSLASLYDFGNQRPGYTHKLCGAPVSGQLEFDGKHLSLARALCGSDWTRALCKHETIWKWASFAGHTSQGARVGLNLSRHIYDDATGASLENAYWIDGRVHALGRVDFHLPKNPLKEVWIMRSADAGGEIDLHFTPLGARQQNTGIGPVKSKFIQPFGLYSGRLSTHRIENVFGVVEDHYARW